MCYIIKIDRVYEFIFIKFTCDLNVDPNYLFIIIVSYIFHNTVVYL